MKSLSYLNTFSSQSVSYDDQGTGIQTLANRYQINGVLDTAKPVMENIEKICSAAGSWLSYDIHEGKWGVVVNQTGTSVASFDDTNILGSITIGGTGLTDLYNKVKVEFPHRDLRDSADYVTISIDAGDRNANEEDNTLNLSYDIINEPIQAQLLGLIELKQSRIDLIINFESDFGNFGLKAGEIIDVTNSKFGFNKKLFRIISTEEIQNDDGALKIGITALEYNSDVYSTANLYRYTRTDSNGIITIGSIGIPGTPQVTKYELDARPRIFIESTAPTGVVEGMEFWITEDYLLQESQRSYKLIASIKPPGGGVFTSGTPVSFDYDNINSGNFLVKTRGFNSTTFGQFSEVSGIINFTSTQVTNAIGPDTKSVDATGQLLTLLGVNLLLKSVDGLFSNDTSSTSSLFKKVFDLFQTVTGNNLLGQTVPVVNSVSPSSGPTSGGTNVTIVGNFLTSATSVTFDGNAATSVNVVNSQTITCITPSNFDGPASVIVTTPTGSNGNNSLFTYVTTGTPILLPSITSINPNFGPPSGGTFVTINGSRLSGTSAVSFGGLPMTSLNVVNSSTVTGIVPANSPGAVNVVLTTPEGTALLTSGYTYIGSTNVLTISNKYPPDRTAYQDPITGVTSDQAPITGSYFLLFGGTFYGQLSRGSTGTVKLYKSDGTLVQTLTPSNLNIQNNRVEFPFSTRDYGTDYYILMDEGVITYCSSKSPGIYTPTDWNFNTPLYSTENYNPTSTPYSTTSTVPEVISSSLVFPNINLTFNTTITKGTGSFSIYKTSDDSLVTTINVTGSVVTDNLLQLNINGILNNNTSYYLTGPAGIVRSYIPVDCFISETPSGVIPRQDFTVPPAFAYVSYAVDSTPFTGTNKVNPQTNIELIFNKSIDFTSTGTATIYRSNGTIHQAIPVTTNFNDNKTSELIWKSDDRFLINPTTDLTPGETYYVTVTPSFVKSTSDEYWSGISNTNTIRFTVDGGPSAPTPIIDFSSPGLVFAFDRQIEASTGTITILDAFDNIVAVLTSTSTGVTIF